MGVGRKPKPTALKVLEGNPGKRPLNNSEPKPQPIAPDCPAHLDKEAKKEWKRIAPELEKLGLLTRIDMAALAGYCQLYSRWIEAEKLIRKHGMIIKTPNGYPAISPFLSISNRTIEQMKSFLVEFGLSPSSRSRINVANTENEMDSFEEFLSRGKKKA